MFCPVMRKQIQRQIRNGFYVHNSALDRLCFSNLLLLENLAARRNGAVDFLSVPRSVGHVRFIGCAGFQRMAQQSLCARGV